ncbi:hypothetical protein F5884DRAFT_207998 [Xylogone sp. PMI_703]|nr:hypothetical protein F5884DRAFT_207998 [Xylogone sp. PMI_703]
MSPTAIEILHSPYLLYTTTLSSFILALIIKHAVAKHGPLSHAGTLTKYNSRIYSIASLLLCSAIGHSLWYDLSSAPNPSLESIICFVPQSAYDLNLRYLFHASKIYEYIDIFNVLASGGVISTHFGIHHFTTPYLTYTRVLSNSAGWKIFAFLNTFHHALMYAYFGGAAVFSDILPFTGGLQLGVGILGEVYIIWTRCTPPGQSVWANVLTVGLLSLYAVLFSGDLRKRERKRVEVDKGG